jgi:hypothetical protein
MNLMYVGLAEHATWADMSKMGVGGWFKLPFLSYPFYSTFTIIGLAQLVTLPVITSPNQRHLWLYGLACALFTYCSRVPFGLNIR